jgi:hypothetical protein
LSEEAGEDYQGKIMRRHKNSGHSALMEKNRDEQRDEIMKKTPGERLLAALELSDACALLKSAARKALEEKRAVAKA